jgi:hypothetical protein
LSHGHLLYTPETLVKRVGNDGEYQRMVNGNKTIYGVVDDLSFDGCHPVVELLNHLCLRQAKVQIRIP